MIHQYIVNILDIISKCILQLKKILTLIYCLIKKYQNLIIFVTLSIFIIFLLYYMWKNHMKNIDFIRIICDILIRIKNNTFNLEKKAPNVSHIDPDEQSESSREDSYDAYEDPYEASYQCKHLSISMLSVLYEELKKIINIIRTESPRPTEPPDAYTEFYRMYREAQENPRTWNSYWRPKKPPMEAYHSIFNCYLHPNYVYRDVATQARFRSALNRAGFEACESYQQHLNRLHTVEQLIRFQENIYKRCLDKRAIIDLDLVDIFPRFTAFVWRIDYDSPLTYELKLQQSKVLSNIQELFKYRAEIYNSAEEIPLDERKMSTFERQIRNASKNDK
jgi:hypothetical protein